jgi:polysaccharide deacetylase family protein (PEP-CTERM system associated)
MRNALTIDVEDYFHVAAFSRVISKTDWDSMPLRVEDSTLRILDLLDEYEVKGTFFVLGWVAKKKPSLVKGIAGRGHEVADHGYSHDLIYEIGPDKFRADIQRSRTLLEDIIGEKVLGYRAPSFSITEKSLWALDILIEEGYRYDSSIYPIFHDTYGMTSCDPFPHEIQRASGSIQEFPMTTLNINLPFKSIRFPVAGGGYLRLLPLWILRKALNQVNSGSGKPVVLYFHPWEIDPAQPRVNAGLKSRFRHYVNLHKTEDKVRKLLSSFRFGPMREVLGVSR